jgi:hypothetical protein
MPNLSLVILFFLSIMLCVFCASGIATEQPSIPNEIELLKARAISAEGQAQYCGLLLRTVQVQDEATAAWWAKVWEALVERDHPVK